MTEPHSKTFMNALKWAYTANWGERAFSSLFMFILAALVGPRDFGIIALAMIYISFVQMVQTQGFQTALVQRHCLEGEHLDTIFWTNGILACFALTLSILFGRWWAALNHVPMLSAYIAVLSICIPLQGMTVVHSALLQRHMDFRSLSLRANVSVICGGSVGLLLAWTGKGIWALVFQQITRDLVALVLLWKLAKWQPRLRFSTRHLRDLLGFSFSNLAAALAVFVDGQGGAIVMGALFGPVAVGLYRLAERVVSSVSSVAVSSIQAVSLPEFSRLQNDPAALKRSVRDCIRMSAIVTIPAMAGLIAISTSLMSALGPKWYPASGVLKLLSLLGMFYMFSMFTGPLLQALNRPNHLAVLEWSRTAVGTVFLVVAAWFVRNSDIQSQIIGLALVRCLFGIVLVTPIYFYLLLRLGRLTLRDAVTSIFPSVMSAISILGSAALLQIPGLLSDMSTAFRLAIQICVGGFAGIAILLVFDSTARSYVARFRRSWIRTPLPSKDML